MGLHTNPTPAHRRTKRIATDKPFESRDHIEGWFSTTAAAMIARNARNNNNSKRIFVNPVRFQSYFRKQSYFFVSPGRFQSYFRISGPRIFFYDFIEKSYFEYDFSRESLKKYAGGVHAWDHRKINTPAVSTRGPSVFLDSRRPGQIVFSYFRISLNRENRNMVFFYLAKHQL